MVLALVSLKARFGWSDKSFTELLVLLKKMLPKDNILPKNHYEPKNILYRLGMEYKKIHAFPKIAFCIEMNLQKCLNAPHVGYHVTKLRITNAVMMEPKTSVIQQRSVGIFQ